jgi:starch synthase
MMATPEPAASTPLRVLFAASEAAPLVKTGGLADVAGALPPALRALGADVRLVLPAYRAVLAGLDPAAAAVATVEVEGAGRRHTARILLTSLADLPVLLVDVPALFDRDGDPYRSPEGPDWWDNGERFTVFCRVVVELARDRAGLDWLPDVVHANDWQTGLVPALLREETVRPRTVFTIHNIAYAGIFPEQTYRDLRLPWGWWHQDGAEFWGNLSLLKAGIAYADRITTVSPTYAREICGAEHGCGLDGLLLARSAVLSGLLNGIDTRVWDPAADSHVVFPYAADRGRVVGKRRNRGALLLELGASPEDAAAPAPLLGFIGRLVEQKGVDLILDAAPGLLAETDVRLVLVTAGDPVLERRLQALAAAHPGRVFVRLAYDEGLAHRVEAGADIFLMPSRFEPCGLNQLYSLRYGTPPIVRRTGGLADSVVDATAASLADGSATGFVFDAPTPDALRGAIDRALDLLGRPRSWQKLQKTGMELDFGWDRSAAAYLALYAG